MKPSVQKIITKLANQKVNLARKAPSVEKDFAKLDLSRKLDGLTSDLPKLYKEPK